MNRITQYLDPAPAPLPPLHHSPPTNETLADDLRSILHQAVLYLGAGLLIGAFLAGMMLPIVAGVWLIFYRE